MAPGSRLLAFASRWFDEGTVVRVFEPLAADFVRECANSPSLALRARWCLAIASTFMRCLPGATFRDLSRPFIIDVAGRAIAFAALAMALQWLLAAVIAPTAGTPSMLSTLPFIVVPVLWRFRLESIPEQQQRLLTLLFIAACIIAAVSTVKTWPLRAAASIALAWLAVSSWRLGHYHLRHPHAMPWWFVLYPAWMIIISSLPIKIALGINFLDPWWPGDHLLAYMIGAAITHSVKDRIQQQIQSG